VRVVSLLPSTTEILFALGAGDDVAGVTIECDYPEEARTRRIVSSATLPAGLTPLEIDDQVRQRLAAGEDLYRVDEVALRELAPDLLLTQDLCAVCAVDSGDVAATMRRIGCTGSVLTVDPGTLEEVLESILAIGSAVARQPAAVELVESLRSRLDAVASRLTGRSRPRVAVVEWTDPPFSAGHWVPDLVTAAGGESIAGRPGMPSRAMSWRAVADADPDVVVVAPCGYRLDGASQLATEVAASGALPGEVPLWAIDADAVVVRPGPRLVDGVEALAGLLHPDAVPGRPELVRRVA
jgi:iron complex transport system substrate-binding protein